MVEFVDRIEEREIILRHIQNPPIQPRVVALDAPAGMGKTHFLNILCMDLIKNAPLEQQWQIVRLDFREDYPRPSRSKSDVLEEIARQLVRDNMWDNIQTLAANATAEDLALLRQAAHIPMANEERAALLHAFESIPDEDWRRIKDLIIEAFNNADLQNTRLYSVDDLCGFIVGQNRPIPDYVLIILDGIDGFKEDGDKMRKWIVNELAVTLGTDQEAIQDVCKRFVIAIAGRFLDQDMDPQLKGRDFEMFDLRSFPENPDNVATLIRSFGDTNFNRQAARVFQLARELTQVCGGHPKVIKEMASELYDASPGHFMVLRMDPQSQAYWYKRAAFKKSLTKNRDEAIEEILDSVGSQERCLLKCLSVFRKFTLATLEFLERKLKEAGRPEYHPCFSKNADTASLYARLQRTRLIGTDGMEPFDSDRFSLRLLAAQMQEQDPELFGLLNQWAVELFGDWIRGKFSDQESLSPNHQYQGVGINEWLFHRLHLVEPCTTARGALKVAETLAAELKQVLESIKPYPAQAIRDRRKSLRKRIEADRQIDHLMRVAACERQDLYQIIKDGVLEAF